MNYSDILSNFQIEQLNEMQEATLTAFSKENNLLLISPTGSGKTLAFLLPLVKTLSAEKTTVQALIIVPTRELAQQIERVFKQMNTGFKISCCYGGHSTQIERNNLVQSPAILVGTPGRLTHHLRKKNVSLKEVSCLILDEFDKSLEAGFEEEMVYIVQNIHQIKKRVLTSATPLAEIPAFVGLKDPTELNFAPSTEQKKATISYKTVRTKDDKIEGLRLLVGTFTSGASIIFCNHREAVSQISEHLGAHQIDHGIYHGGLDQIDREKTLIKLRNGSINLLISTDLAARGLDIPEIEHVIHYQLPMTEDVMVHRNGRTARMHATGTVYFLLGSGDHLPDFFNTETEDVLLPKKASAPKPVIWKTLYISAGKKDKVNKMDIAGMLYQKGGLTKEDLGKIEVLDHSAYAAIKRDKIGKTLQLIGNERVKNKKVKIEISS